MADQTVKLLFEAEDKASAAIKDVNKAIDGSKDSSDKASTSLASFGKVLVGVGAALVGAKVVKGTIDYSKQAVASASDLNETLSKTTVVFGEQAEEMVEFGKSAATTMGMTTNEALSAAATYGNLFRAMEMEEDVSAEMSKSLVTLAADLASFNNIDTVEVLGKLRAGLTGETEPLKALGVNISAAAVQAAALEQGLIEVGDEMTPAIKATATYGLILEQTELAQGDFLRTSDGLANSQRILEASMTDIKTTMGTVLLPVVTELTSAFGKFLTDNAPLIEELSTKLSTFLVPALESVGKFASGALDALTRLLSGESWSSIWEGTGPMMDELGNMVEGKAGLKDTFTGIGENIADFIMSGIAGLVTRIPGALDGLATKFSDWALGDGKTQSEQVGKDIAGFIIDSIKSLFGLEKTAIDLGGSTESMLVSAIDKINISGAGLLGAAVSGLISGTFDAVLGDEVFSDSMATKLTDALTWWYKHINVITVAKEILAKMKESWQIGIDSFKGILSGDPLFPGLGDATTKSPITGKGFASGFSGIISRPTLMMVGEGGTERVSVRPTGGPAGGGGNSLVFNIYTSNAQAAGDAVMQRLRARGLA